MSISPLVRLEQQGSVLIVSPLFTFGTFAEADVAAGWEQIETRLHDETVCHATVDLGEIPYFGSTVLEWMVLIWKRIRARGGRVAVCNCSEMSRQILTTVRFDTLWAICDDRAAALSRLQ